MHHHSLSVYYLIMHTKKFKKFARVCLILYTEERERERAGGGDEEGQGGGEEGG